MKKERRSSFTLAAEITALVLVFVIIIVAAGADAIKREFDRGEYPRPYKKAVESAAKEFGVEENLIYAVMKAESKFDVHAVSSSGALGLMQIMPHTYETDIKENLGISKDTKAALLDPEINIRCGTYYLSRWLLYFDDMNTALAAYNAGFGNVRKWLSDTAYSSDGERIIAENIPFKETREYVLRVSYYYEEYNRLYPENADTPNTTEPVITNPGGETVGWITRGPDEKGRIFVNETACYAWAKKYCGTYFTDVDPILVMAIIKTESDFVVNAVSSSGAYGLMQIMPATYKIDIKTSMDLTEDFEYLLEDPEFAIKCGTYYLHWLYADSRMLGGSMINVIASYHGGCNAVVSWLSSDELAKDGELIVSKIPIKETGRYVEKVLANYEYYNNIFGK